MSWFFLPVLKSRSSKVSSSGLLALYLSLVATSKWAYMAAATQPSLSLYQHGTYHDRRNVYAAPFDHEEQSVTGTHDGKLNHQFPYMSFSETDNIPQPQCELPPWKRLKKRIAQGYQGLSRLVQEKQMRGLAALDEATTRTGADASSVLSVLLEGWGTKTSDGDPSFTLEGAATSKNATMLRQGQRQHLHQQDDRDKAKKGLDHHHLHDEHNRSDVYGNILSLLQSALARHDYDAQADRDHLQMNAAAVLDVWEELEENENPYSKAAKPKDPSSDHDSSTSTLSTPPVLESRLLSSWHFRFRRTCYAGFSALLFFLLEVEWLARAQNKSGLVVAPEKQTTKNFKEKVERGLLQRPAACASTLTALLAYLGPKLQAPMTWLFRTPTVDYPMQLHIAGFPFGNVGIIATKEVLRMGKYRTSSVAGVSPHAGKAGRASQDVLVGQDDHCAGCAEFDEIYGVRFKPQFRFRLPDTDSDGENINIGALSPEHGDNAFAVLDYLFKKEATSASAESGAQSGAPAARGETSGRLMVDVGVFDGGDWAAAAIERGVRTIGFEPLRENREQFRDKIVSVYGEGVVEIVEHHSTGTRGEEKDHGYENGEQGARTSKRKPISALGRASFILKEIFRPEFVPAAAAAASLGKSKEQNSSSTAVVLIPSTEPPGRSQEEMEFREGVKGNPQSRTHYFFGNRWVGCMSPRVCEEMRANYTRLQTRATWTARTTTKMPTTTSREDSAPAPLYRLYPYALGEEEAVDVRMERRGDYSSLQARDDLGVRRDVAFHDRGSNSTVELVQVKTLGGVLTELLTRDESGAPTPIVLLKIDVEGYELGVLRGAAELLARKHGGGRVVQHIYLEFQPAALLTSGTDPESVLWYLTSLGYRCRSRQLGGLLWQHQRVTESPGASENGAAAESTMWWRTNRYDDAFRYESTALSFRQYVALWESKEQNVVFDPPWEFADDLLCENLSTENLHDKNNARGRGFGHLFLAQAQGGPNRLAECSFSKRG